MRLVKVMSIVLSSFVFLSGCSLFKKAPVEKKPEVKQLPSLSLKEMSEKYLEGFKHSAGVTALPSGLLYQVIEQGAGKQPTEADKVLVHYNEYLADSRTVKNTNRNFTPELLTIKDQIPGFKEALLRSKEGTHFKAVLPWAIAYGEKGNAEIPPNAVVIFDGKVIEVNPKK